MKKGQTSNEYIIIFAVVLVMVVVIVSMFGDFNMFSSPTSDRNLKAEWLVSNPIGISYWTSTPNGTYIHFRNNVDNIITINRVTLEGREYDVGKTFAKDGKIEFQTSDINTTNDYSYKILINYSYKETEGNYVFENSDMPISGKSSTINN